MLFKSKADQESIDRAQKMYGAGINRGLAGFVSGKTDTQVQKPVKEPLITTTDQLPEHFQQVIGILTGTGATADQAIQELERVAAQSHARAVLAVRIVAQTTKLIAYGTAVK